MSYVLRVEHRAGADLRRLDRRTQERIASRLQQIADGPYGIQSKALRDTRGRRAARVGDWRIIYSVDESAEVMATSVIAPRGRAYRDIGGRVASERRSAPADRRQQD